MEKNQIFTLNCDTAILNLDFVIHPVPGGKIRSPVLQHDHPRKTFGPVIQIFLIRKAPRLNPVMAPLEAAFAPPLQTLASISIIPECQQPDIVPAEFFFSPARTLRKAMRNNQNRLLSHLLIDWSRVTVKEKIRI